MLGVTAALLLAPASHAGASTVSVVGGEIHVVAPPGQTNVVAVVPANNKVDVSDTAGTVAGAGCNGGGASVTCNVSPSTVRLTLGDGDDRYDGSGTDLIVHASGGAGNDTLIGGLVGDTLDGGAGDDHLDGGPFIMAMALLADTYVGGDGVDTVSYASRANGVRVDTDGVEDDGASGESDNVGIDVERVLGGSGNDTLTGNGAPNELLGGGGDDTLDGGGGIDRIDAGAGADTVTSRDAGTADTVACGADADRVTADRVDAVSDCETVDLPALPQPVPTATPSPKPTPPPPGPVANGKGITIVEKTVVLAPGAKTLPVTVSCGEDQPDDCSGTLSITVRIPVTTKKSKRASASRRGRKMKSVTIGTAKFTVTKGKSKLISAKVSRRGVNQALKTTKTSKTARGPVKRIKARMTISVGGKTTKAPLTVEVPGAAR